MTLSHSEAIVNRLNREREKFGALALSVTWSVKMFSMLVYNPDSLQKHHSWLGNRDNPNQIKMSPPMNHWFTDGEFYERPYHLGTDKEDLYQDEGLLEPKLRLVA